MLHPINNIPWTVFLQFTPSLQPCATSIQGRGYVLAQAILTVANTGNYYIRFTREYLGTNWLLLPPYGDLPNDPWFIRIMINMQPWDVDWGLQNFNPAPPYILAAWVPGTVQATNIIQFERTWMLPGNLPDILVFDQSYNFKCALAGSQKEGFEYPWKYNQIIGIDPWQARVQVGPGITLDPTDIVYGFYFYAERDLIYTALDVNPFTNPDVRDRVVNIFQIPTTYTANLHTAQTFFYQILNSDGSYYKTNGPGVLLNTTSHPSWVTFIGSIIAGVAPPTTAFTVTDARARGGGLAPQFQQIPQANSFWDLGYLDGRPYPLGQHRGRVCCAGSVRHARGVERDEWRSHFSRCGRSDIRLLPTSDSIDRVCKEGVSSVRHKVAQAFWRVRGQNTNDRHRDGLNGHLTSCAASCA